ncbi:MAG: Flp family type IVb pilin [Croceibacterium sp.]
MRVLRQLLKDSAGATAVEYGLIVALIVIAIFTALNSVSSSTTSMWNRVSSALSTASNAA